MPQMVGWLVVFYVPLTARSFRDGTPIYCPLRRTWSSVFTPSSQGIEFRAVAWQSITLLLRHAGSLPQIGWHAVKSINQSIMTRTCTYGWFCVFAVIHDQTCTYGWFCVFAVITGGHREYWEHADRGQPDARGEVCGGVPQAAQCATQVRAQCYKQLNVPHRCVLNVINSSMCHTGACSTL